MHAQKAQDISAHKTLIRLNPEAKHLVSFIARGEHYLRFGIAAGGLPEPLLIKAKQELVVIDSGRREKRRIAPDIMPTHIMVKKISTRGLLESDDPIKFVADTPVEIVEMAREIEYLYLVHTGTREILGLIHSADEKNEVKYFIYPITEQEARGIAVDFDALLKNVFFLKKE